MAVINPGAKFTLVFRDIVRGDGWSEGWHLNNPSATVAQTIQIAKDYAAVRAKLLGPGATITGGRAANDLHPRLGFPFGNPLGLFPNQVAGDLGVAGPGRNEFSWDSLDILFPLVGGRRKWIYVRGVSDKLLLNAGLGWDPKELANDDFDGYLAYCVDKLAVACRANEDDVASVPVPEFDRVDATTSILTLAAVANPFTIGQKVHLYGPKTMGLPIGDHIVKAVDVGLHTVPNVEITHDGKFAAPTGVYAGLKVQAVTAALYSVASVKTVLVKDGIPVLIRASHRKSGRDPISQRGRSRRPVTVA